MSVVSDTLVEARWLIVERGWWRLGDGDPKNNVPSKLCISTAIQVACHGDVHGGFEYQRFCAAMQAVRDVVGGQDPIRYNDTVGRTEAEVLATLDRAIARSV